jgi:hypothetical protein
MPWYSIFMVSWLNFPNPERICFVRYDDIVSRLDNVFNDISKITNNNEIPLIFNKTTNSYPKKRLNIGDSGRGMKLLDKSHITQLNNQASILKKYPRGAEFFQYLTTGNC